MFSRRSIILCVLAVLLVFAWFGQQTLSSRWHAGKTAAPTIDKQSINFARRTFDPAAPPADMPKLSSGEEAVCDSNFVSNVNVGGEAQQTDATHAVVTIASVKVTLHLDVTIWVPNAATQRVLEHEEGHRQISEYYYQTADKLVERIAAAYIGSHVLITGADVPAELSKLLQQTGAEITDKYNKELDPEPVQLRYDAITDHSRNDIAAEEAVAQVLKGVTLVGAHPAAN